MRNADQSESSIAALAGQCMAAHGCELADTNRAGTRKSIGWQKSAPVLAAIGAFLSALLAGLHGRIDKMLADAGLGLSER